MLWSVGDIRRQLVAYHIFLLNIKLYSNTNTNIFQKITEQKSTYFVRIHITGNRIGVLLTEYFNGPQNCPPKGWSHNNNNIEMSGYIKDGDPDRGMANL